jgi:aspartate carbamoyltransferase catalytic subunit
VVSTRSAMWTHRHLLGIEALSPDDIDTILDRAERWYELWRLPEKKAALLRGRTIINLFFENSTRTRTSFEAAGKRLGGEKEVERLSGEQAGRGGEWT